MVTEKLVGLVDDLVSLVSVWAPASTWNERNWMNQLRPDGL